MALKVRKNSKFKIIQISNTYIVTSIKIYKDTINIYRNNLLESETNLLIVKFIKKILDIEKPDLIILTRD